MKLEDVTVALRPREPWEAVDLGCSMVRRDFGQLMALWAATVLPVWLVIIVLMHDMAAWFTLVIWWLKPLYDRVPLFFMSKAAFGVRPGFRETWQAWPRLWMKDLFPALILRRLSMIRSFALPVIMLEGQHGKSVRARITALATDGGGSGATVTWVFVKLEIVVFLGLIAFTSQFVPESVSPNWGELVEFQDASDFVVPPAYYWWMNICYLVAVTLVEPFYVGAGFGLYLNCRTRLEGWDVELAFRRLASRLRGLAATVVATIVMMFALVSNAAANNGGMQSLDVDRSTGNGGLIGRLIANDALPPHPSPLPREREPDELWLGDRKIAFVQLNEIQSRSRLLGASEAPSGSLSLGERAGVRGRSISRLLSSTASDTHAISSSKTPDEQKMSSSKNQPPFSEAAKVRATRPGKAKSPPETLAANKAADEILAKPEFKVHKRTVKEWRPDSVDFSPDLTPLKILAYIAFWLALAAIISGIVIFIMRNRHLLGLPQLMPKKPARHKTPRVVMGMDIGRDSLPEDIVGTARELWKTKGSREALSLLYRGALSQLVERQRLPIRDSDTEDDCLDHVRRVGERRMTAFFSQLTNTWITEAYAGIAVDESEFGRLCGDWPFQAEGSSQKGLAASPAAALLILIVPFIASCSGHWEDVEKTLGYKGKARIDPFLAAEMLLKEHGHTAERTPTLGKLPDAQNGLVFTSSEAGVPEGRAKQLLGWVARGGHLVYCVAGAMPYNDWSGGSNFFINFGTDERPDPILAKLGVKLNDHRPKLDLKGKKKVTFTPPKERDKKGDDTDKTKKEKEAARIGDTVVMKDLNWNGQSYLIEASDKITFTPSRPLKRSEWSTSDDKDAPILSLHHGAGRITLLNHARPLRNKHLAEHDHAAWLVALAGENRRAIKDVRFVVGMTASFWTLLWQRAWMPLVGLALVIAVWLWKNGRRFGPIMPLELSETKHFTDHISALGQFFFRLRRGDVLLKSAADAVRSRFRQKFPQLAIMPADVTGAFSPESAAAAATGQTAPITSPRPHRTALGTDDAMIRHLATQSGLSADRVQAALAAHPPGQNHQLVRLLHDLQLLRQSL